MDIKEIVWDNVDWIDIVEGRDKFQSTVDTAMNVRLPLSDMSFLYC